MVSSCDRRIGDVPAASHLHSSSLGGRIRNYRFRCPTRATNVGNPYPSRQPASPAADSASSPPSDSLADSLPILLPTCSLRDYDLASRQSKIPAIQRKQESGLPSFGEKLKQEREKRKITLEQISASTKIGTRMLQALEEDKFNHLPGGIFNKGFVRAYARFVGLDEDQTVADYLQASGDAPPPSTEIAPREDVAREAAENVARLEATSDNPPRPLPWGLFAALLLMVALALSL